MSTGEAEAALIDLRAHIAADAENEAELTVRAAEADALAEQQRAEADAAAITGRAVALGRRRAEAMVTATEHRAARQRRAAILAARRAADDGFRAASTAAVLGLADESGYPAVLEALRATAFAVLGPEADVTIDPGGGLIARAGGRLLDLRFGTVAARAIAETTAQIGEVRT
ncbi:hypothetical protein [Nocardia sp. BMG111209]|uniref:hypothetical protein n=1 Tax=Nocardia sp. BMG111209 TaxID=1160137 RepID=UPI000361ED90|nr:hypothetical protein [Nocardia sp. BMG111209]